jgi:hypothetical protein
MSTKVAEANLVSVFSVVITKSLAGYLGNNSVQTFLTYKNE